MVARSGLTLGHVVLLCADLDGTARFYRRALGLPVERELPGWLELRAAETLLSLRPRDRPYDGPPPLGSGVQLAFRVRAEEVDRWHAKLLRLGVTVLEPPQTHDSGHRTLFFRDPEGNVVEIYAEV